MERQTYLPACSKSRLWARAVPSAAKAVFKMIAISAAVNRCATQKQVQHQLLPQSATAITIWQICRVQERKHPKITVRMLSL